VQGRGRGQSPAQVIRIPATTKGEQVNLTARLASLLRNPGSRRTDEARLRTALAVPHPAGGTGARSAVSARTRLLVAVTATVTALLLAVSGTSALATTGHTFAGSFGAFGGSPLPGGVGVGLSGEVFVAGAPEEVQRFDAVGELQSGFANEHFPYPGGVAVDSALGGGVYLSSSGNSGTSFVDKYSAAGLFEYSLDASLSETSINQGPVAVDPADGTVYTAATNFNTGAQVIDSFSQTTGVFIASFDGSTGSPDGGFGCPGGLAVDPTHHEYVLDGCKGRIDRYSAAGTWEATIDNGGRGAPLAVATNPQTGEVYVADAGPSGVEVTNLSAEGSTVIQTFSAAMVAGLAGLAVGPDGTVYVADKSTSVIDRFTAFEGPTVVTEPASEIGRTSATFNGTVNAEGFASKYHYEFGVEPTYGSSTPEIDAGSGNTAEASPGPVTGLVPNTTYHYRIVGLNASGSILGEDKELTTEAAPPAVDGSPAFVSSITPTGARVHATVNPEHSLTRFSVEYGTTTAYGSSTPEGGAEVGEQSTDQAVVTSLTGLEPGTLYHYRVSAENGVEGAQTGADGTFVTAPATPAGATELSTKRATLTGTVDPHGEATSYRFEYGPSTSYGAATGELSAGSGEGEQHLTEPVTGLTPGTLYHVRVVATANGITRTGADGIFTTAPAPEAEATDPTAVSTSGATFQGTTNTFGLPGTYHFEVASLDGTYSANTAEQALSAVSGARPVSFIDGSLPPGETFRVRLVVTSNEASTVSEPVPFATPALPPEGFPAPPAPASVYGCTAPKLNPVNGKVRPGATINVTGSDLGLSGTVLLGESTLLPTGWTPGGFTVEVPADAVGTLGLTVNCGVASNTVAVATTSSPVNTFTVTKKSVKGSTATFSLDVPGPGAIQSSSARTKGTAGKVTAAGAQTVTVTLSKAGAKALRKARKRKLAVRVQLRFTPTGGSTATQTATVTFTRKGGHR
jgi:hypothetical protein